MKRLKLDSFGNRPIFVFWRIASRLPLVMVTLGASRAFADGFSRADFDTLMHWVNLAILVVLIVKFMRRPIAVFLAGKKQEVGLLITRYEDQKRAAEDKIIEGQTMLNAGQQRLALIKNKIIEEGRRRQAEIIADAEREAQLLFDTVKMRIGHQVDEAYRSIKSELVDTAAQQALALLPQRITAENQSALVEQWIDAVES